MALSNDVDREALHAGLLRWIGQNLPDCDDPEITDLDIPQASGLSALTALFSATYGKGGERRAHRFVMRALARSGGVFERSSLETEYKTLCALAEQSTVAVPRPRGIELSDDSICGMPFMLMDFVGGRVPRDDPPYTVAGWVTELDDAERARLSANAFAEMARIHDVDHAALGLGWLADVPCGAPDLVNKLDQWEQYYRWAGEGVRDPLIETAFEWMRANIPAQSPPVISWGDSRIGNMIIADDLTVGAVVDWEMLGLGSREVDVGWWIFTRRFHTDAIGVPLPGGFRSEAQLLSDYEQLTGYAPQNIDFYIAFAGLRLSLAMKRLGNMMIANGQLPPDASMPYSNPASHLLADCIGVTRPSADMMDFVGNREKKSDA